MTGIWSEIPRHGKWLTLLLLLAFIGAPLIVDRYLLSVLVLVLYFTYLGQAWNLLMGYAGQLSLGHALYLGLGAYTATTLWLLFGIGPWIGVFVAIAVAGAAGLIVGWLGWRFGVEGVYFALLTIAFAEFTRIGFDHLLITGASGGLFLPVSPNTHDWWNLNGGVHLFYYVALILAVAATVLVAWLRQSPLGYRWLAVREDPLAAQAVGIDVFRARMIAMAISAGMTAVGGVFYGFYYRNLFPSQIFDISRSIELILGPIIGGLGTIFGPIVGAIILTPVGETLTTFMQRSGLNVPGAKSIFYGIILMIIISLRPSGVWPWLAKHLRLDRQSK